MQRFKAITERIRTLGVTDVFTSTSKDICELVAELSVIGVKIHHTRHEQVAMGMADGYFRSSGRVGVVGDLDVLTKRLPGLRGPLLLDSITSNDVVKSYTSFARERACKQGQLVGSA